jgi:hypothetical protein
LLSNQHGTYAFIEEGGVVSLTNDCETLTVRIPVTLKRKMESLAKQRSLTMTGLIKQTMQETVNGYHGAINAVANERARLA